MKTRILILALGVLGIVFLLNIAYADGNSQNGQNSGQIGRDGRLPPVIPGETVELPSGEKMKVWSSTGPVPIATVPTVGNGYNGGVGDIDVIVDDRHDDRRFDNGNRHRNP